MGRYDKKYSNDSLGNTVMAMICPPLLLTGGLDTKHECEITDTQTGETSTGYGHSKSEAESDAYNKLKS